VHRENPLNEGDEEIKKERTGFFFVDLSTQGEREEEKYHPQTKVIGLNECSFTFFLCFLFIFPAFVYVT
jgi:hypothetical protein